MQGLKVSTSSGGVHLRARGWCSLPDHGPHHRHTDTQTRTQADTHTRKTRAQVAMGALMQSLHDPPPQFIVVTLMRRRLGAPCCRSRPLVLGHHDPLVFLGRRQGVSLAMLRGLLVLLQATALGCGLMGSGGVARVVAFATGLVDPPRLVSLFGADA